MKIYEVLVNNMEHDYQNSTIFESLRAAAEFAHNALCSSTEPCEVTIYMLFPNYDGRFERDSTSYNFYSEIAEDRNRAYNLIESCRCGA